MKAAAAIDRLRIFLEAATGWTLAPQLYDARTNPRPNFADTFSLETTATRNTGLLRDQGVVRLEHDVRVTWVSALKMSDKWATSQASMDVEHKILTALGAMHSLSPIRVEYVGTERTVTPSREYLYTRLALLVSHDVERAA